MAQKSKTKVDSNPTWTASDEENLLWDTSEGKRLQRLGIDPDGDPIDIMIALERRKAQLEAKADEG